MEFMGGGFSRLVRGPSPRAPGRRGFAPRTPHPYVVAFVWMPLVRARPMGVLLVFGLCVVFGFVRGRWGCCPDSIRVWPSGACTRLAVAFGSG